MALIEKQGPSRADLKWFGVIFAVFFGLIGAMAWWRFEAHTTGKVLWGIGGVVAAVYYLSPHAIRWAIFTLWVTITHPIGYVVSHLVLALVYFGVMTPLGVAMRVAGRDTMKRRFDPQATTYWEPHEPVTDTRRYFRQF